MPHRPTTSGLDAQRRSPRSPTTASCPTARRPRWSRPTATSSGCACRGWTRRACSARCWTATPATSGSARPASSVPAGRRYLPGTMVLETSWGTRGGWIVVRDVLLIGPWHHAQRPLAHAPPHADRLRRRPRPAAHRAVRQRRGPARALLRARVRLRASSARTGSTASDGYHVAVARAPGSDVELRLTTDLNLGIEGPRRHRAPPDQGGRDAVLRALVERAPGAARPTRRPTSGSSGPRTTGSTGSTAASSPTTRGAPTCSAPRSRSRASRTRRPARSSPPRPRRCPRRPAASATGTTATRWIRDSTFALWGLYTLGFDWEANDFFYFVADMAKAADDAADHVRHRRPRRSCPSARSTTSPATRARGRSASATTRTRRPSTTSGARCSTRSTCTRSRATRCRRASGRC